MNKFTNEALDARNQTIAAKSEIDDLNPSDIEEPWKKFNAVQKRVYLLKQAISNKDFEEVTSVNYTTKTPKDKLPYAEIQKIGGMSYEDSTNSVLQSGKVTKILSVSKNLIPFPYAQSKSTKNGVTFIA